MKKSTQIGWNMEIVKKYFILTFLLIEYSNSNFREILNDETLKLRKKKQIQEIFSSRGIYISDRDRHQVCPLKLKGIPEQIQEKFRIIPGDVDTIKKAMEYLNSKELNEIKFGAFLLRRFFSVLVKEDAKLDKQNQYLDYKIDSFLENNLIQSVGKVLTNERNIDIISELTWALVNITYLDAEKGGNEYIKGFMNQTYMNIFYKLIKMGDNEVLANLYQFLVNCVIDCDEFAKFIFSEQNFIRFCIFKYLEQNKPEKLEQEAKKAAIYFFISLSKLSNSFSEKQKNTFYKIYEKFLGVNFDSVFSMNIIIGIRSLFTFDKSGEKTMFNIIKKNKYDLFDKLFKTFNIIYKDDPDFSGKDIIIFNVKKIIDQFIQLSEEKDIIILVRNTQLINFINNFFEVLFFKTTRILLLDIIVELSHHTSDVVLNMIRDRDEFLKTIKKYLNTPHFDIKMKLFDIIHSMLSFLSLDIDIILYRNEIIDYIITDILPLEEEKTCLNYILSSILFFIKGIKPLEKKLKIEIVNYLNKLGISNGFENLSTRFNEGHISLINEINSGIKNILNEENVEKNDIININFEIDNKNLFVSDTNNPFLNFNKSND